MNCEFMIRLSMKLFESLLHSYLHDYYSLVFLLRSIDLVWPTRLIYLAMGEVLCSGFDLAVLNPSDRKGHDTYVSLLLRVKRWGLFIREFILSTSCRRS